ncbi:hypothetical protein RF644_17650 [Kocuria sp. CPCC 205258]|uniref:hypothetical protein n=1 Tax=Kocuria sp. CPCC 205258 TaxID=3073552 RepID=UPI0034D4E042
MTSSSAAPAVPLSCRVTTPGDSRLLSMRPHVLRIRAVHTSRGPASVYLHHLDDEVLVGATLRSMLYDLARITATQLGESSRLLEHRGSTVELHELEEHDLAPGPAVEVMLCMHEREGVLMEICFDGLPIDAHTCRWVVDTLVATSWRILEEQR